MSSGLVGQVIEHYPGNGDELLLAIIIADNATRHGAVLSLPPSELADLSRRSEKTVRRTLAKMEESRWLVCIERSKGGHRRPTIYQINPDWVKLPIGWSGKEPGQIDQVVATKHGQFDHVEPGHNMDNLTMFPRETSPDFDGESSLFKSITPYSPPNSQRASGSAVPSATAPDQRESLRLAHWLFGVVLTVFPKHRTPNWPRWERDIAVMLRKGHSAHDIAALFLWASRDEFWRANVRCPAKLWKHWDTLTIRRSEAKPAMATTVSPLCEDCNERPWSRQQGKTGRRRCGHCADLAERAA